MTTRAVPLRLRYREVPRLPRLAWVATIDRAAGDVLVFHGSAVECREEWMVEGVWDAEFRSGGFHECPHFFGSGLRLADGCLYCVPSSALVNRLMYCVHRDRVLVANSLALLLAFTGATLAPGHDYRAETYAIRRGVRGYPKAFVVRHPEIASFFQVYDECLVIGSGEPTFESGRPVRTIASFAAYRALVAEALGRLQDNFLSRYRDTPMQAFSTVSTGYDSAASTVLVKDLDLETCFTSRRSNSHIPWWLNREAGSDDGRPIADRLGLRTEYLDGRASRMTEDELYFLAPGCAPPLPVLHSMARHIERSGAVGVVFTGFQGDEVWDINRWEREYQDAGVLRGDTTAIMLSEIRLKSGFINVPVPSLFARSLRYLVAIALSVEMAPWRLGSDYDRPIPRRILEEAGIPRQLFGTRKKAVVETYNFPKNRALRRQFFAYARRQLGVFGGGGFIRLYQAVNGLVFPSFRAYHLVRQRLTGVEPPDTPAALIWTRFNFPHLLFTWAAGALSERLASVLRDSGALEQQPLAAWKPALRDTRWDLVAPVSPPPTPLPARSTPVPPLP